METLLAEHSPSPWLSLYLSIHDCLCASQSSLMVARPDCLGPASPHGRRVLIVFRSSCASSYRRTIAIFQSSSQRVCWTLFREAPLVRALQAALTPTFVISASISLPAFMSSVESSPPEIKYTTSCLTPEEVFVSSNWLLSSE